MHEAFEISGKSKVVFHHKDHRLRNIFTEYQIKDTKHIYISTYNFNFEDKGPDSPYVLLKKAAIEGVMVTLVYACEHNNIFTPDEEFKKLIKCIHLNENNLVNHSKIIILDSVAYVGSANFSKSSDFNFECGTILFNRADIKNLRNLFKKVLIAGRTEKYNREELGLEIIDEIECLSMELSDLIEAKIFDKNMYSNCINKIVESNHSVLNDIYGIAFGESDLNYLREIKKQLNTGVELSDDETDELKYILKEFINLCYNATNDIYSLIESIGMIKLADKHYK
ncbi:phospholipase D-like domain-containing protein [Bacillus wiedmannii]|uniref:phospholipase D-like domain-containing protein n=1 Tax=Bacillus wiedmannii TaxID=1890302 RepID=UPI0015D49974|nr:phospholipase D-like domain-containing protein [Bacillus wiedmannii]